MKETVATGKILFGLFGGLLSFMFGELDMPLKALVALVIIDYGTGVLCAAVERKLSSEVGYKGIAKKIGIFAVVAVAHLIDMIAFKGIDNLALRSVAIFFYLANEGLSIVENAARLGIPIPQKLRIMLEQLKEENEEQTHIKEESEEETEEESEGGEEDGTDAEG